MPEDEDIDMDSVHDSRAFIYHHLNMLDRPSTPGKPRIHTSASHVAERLLGVSAAGIVPQSSPLYHLYRYVPSSALYVFVIDIITGRRVLDCVSLNGCFVKAELIVKASVPKTVDWP